MHCRLLTLIVFSFLLTACVSNQTIPVNPAHIVPMTAQNIPEKEAKRRFRDTLVNILTESPITNEGERIHKLLSPVDYVGAKVSPDQNSVFFLFEDKQLGLNSYFRKFALFADVNKGAEATLYFIPENITRGLLETRHDSYYALLIKNASICRAYYVENVRSNGDFWAFTSKKNITSTACFGRTEGSIQRPIASLNTYNSLKPLLGDKVYSDYAIIEHRDPEKLKDLANLFIAAFPNLK